MSFVWLILMALQMFSELTTSNPNLSQGFTPADITDLVYKVQLRRKLEMALNRNVAPSTTSKSSRDLSPRYQKPRAPDVASPVKEVPNSKLSLLAEALDSQRPDTVTFTFGPRLRATISNNLRKAVLIVRIRPVKSKRRQGKANMKIAAESEIAEKIRNVTSEKAIKKELLLRIRQTQNQDDYDYEENRYPSGEEDNETRKGSDVAPRKSSTRGQDKKLRELPTADVKVVIKIIDSVTGKKRRLTASQVDVKEPSDVKVTLTKEVNEALHSPNHTLTLQVTCKRCKRRVHLEKLFKTSKRKNKANGLRTRRLNPNRPYLVITTNENSATENNNAKSIRDSRSKRHAPNSCPEGEYLQKFLLLGEKSDTCCSERIYVTFDQLGLDDVIIFPKGFSTVNCLGSCGRSVSALHPRTTSGDELRTADEELRRRASGETRVGDVSPGTVGNTRQCTSIQKSSLDLFYLNENNTVIPMKLDNFIDEACGCLS